MLIQITKLSTTAGFLKESPISFAPGLTCLIGARGTCKSTIVETIRFIFDCDQQRVRQLCASSELTTDVEGSSMRGLVRATLQGGLAKCCVARTTLDGLETLTVERETDSQPRVYHDGIEQLVDRSILHEVEIYSQGDLQRIAEDEHRRLELIDRPNKKSLETLHGLRTALATELQGLGPKIREKATEIEARRADVRVLESLQTQLSELQAQRPRLTDELDAERTAALKRKSLLENIRKALSERDAMRNLIRSTLTASSEEAALVASLRNLSFPAAESLATLIERLNIFRDASLRNLDTLFEENPIPYLQEIEVQFEKHNSRYRQLRLEQQEINDSLKREDSLKQQISHLEKLQAELEKFSEDQRNLIEKRKELRVRFKEIGDRIYELREQEVEKINNRHNDVIVLTLNPGAQSAEYTRRLSGMLQGSRLRGQDEVARDLSARVRPCDLIDIVEAGSGDSSRLAALLDRDLSQMARLIAYLTDRPELYELEGIIFEDHLEITLYDKAIPKPINQLSKGQMATALLPLILRPAPYPLIFDQPEDDLDNSFIFKTLVEQIQLLKKDRQLIFVTHNANIPVLGEADSVVVMEMATPCQAKPPLVGSVDTTKFHILDLLEGGSDAFRRRQQKYDSLLHPCDDLV